MKEDKLKKILKVFLIILVVVIIIYLYVKEDNNDDPILATRLTKQEQLELKVEELKEDNYKLEEDLSHANSRLEELEREYEYAKDLIDVLKEQLEEYGIEPYEL